VPTFTSFIDEAPNDSYDYNKYDNNKYDNNSDYNQNDEVKKKDFDYYNLKHIVQNELPENTTDNKDEYSFLKLAIFDDVMKRRLRTLIIKMKRLYNYKYCQNDQKAWAILFDEYQFKTDFKNIEFLSKLIDCVVSLNKLSGVIQDYIFKVIFAENDSQKYDVLKKKFNEIKKPVGNFVSSNVSREVIEMVIEGVSIRKIGSVIRKTVSKPRRVYHVNFRVILPITFAIIIIYAVNHANSAYNKPAYTDLTYTERFTTPQYLTDPLKLYVKFAPYEVDLNNDGKMDGIYYSQEKDCFMVELYSNGSKQLSDWGKLTDYTIKHPEIFMLEKVRDFLK